MTTPNISMGLSIYFFYILGHNLVRLLGTLSHAVQSFLIFSLLKC